MLLLAPGPVPMSPELASLADITQLPYFRGEDFVRLVLELTPDLQNLFQTTAEPLTVTASGTGAMEMAIVNLLNPGERVVVVNGGNFGTKWVSMARSFAVDVVEFPVSLGASPDLQALADCLPRDATALLINAHETSTGNLYDLRSIGQIARERDLLFIVDGVSSVGADEYRMDEWGIDCSMVCSHKALACMPGLAFIAFSERAWQRMPEVRQPRYYFNALEYRNNLSRGMLPFTPAMVAMLQVKRQLEHIRAEGMEGVVARHRRLAQAFRESALADPRFGLFPDRPSNAMTALRLPPGVTATALVQHFRLEHDWWFSPNHGGNEHYLRVSHMGDLREEVMREVASQLRLAADRLQ